MNKRIKWYSDHLVKKHNMMLAPIGDYWSYAQKYYPELQIYNDDGTHPSQQGSLIISLIFYKILVDSTIEDITYWPDYLDKKERQLIFELTSRGLPSSF